MTLHFRAGLAGAIIALLLTVATASAQTTQQTDSSLTATITEWNRIVFEIAIAEDRLLTLKGLRTAAMLHLSVHDALNAIDHRYETFASPPPTPTAAPLAAAAQAAFEVASSQYPDHADRFDRLLSDALGAIEDTVRRNAGIELGRKCANTILDVRSDDGWNTEAEYQWHPMGPGVYAEFNEHSGTPEGFVFGSGWAKATPFVLNRSDQFRVPPPPEIQSEEYTAAYREVKEVGRFQTLSRTPDQTHLALWWKDFIENSHNRLARALVWSRQLDPWSTARVFALLNLSIYDAYVCCFDNKFHYNHWRPFTAIRWAAHDGNPATEPDTLWDNLHRHSYAFPSYPSAHGAASAAAATILAETFGDTVPFTMNTPFVDIAGPLSAKFAMDPPTRTFSSFSAAAMECAMSRVYLGIHFRYDSVEGNALGRQVGEFIVHRVLRPKDE